MSDSIRNSTEHIRLFIPGPTEVRPEILDAQTQWMIGHRMPECAELIGRIEPKLKEVFRTRHRVYLFASSGTGFWEAAIRNTVNKKVLNCVSGAFADRWRQVSEANGKENEVLEEDWGKPIVPEKVAERLSSGEFDAVTVVHNETSTGVLNPLREIAAAVRSVPNGDEIMILVDSVSGMSGAQCETDEWDLDVVLTSSQKAFALPAGLAMGSVSERAFEKAKTVPNRGYYFDFLTYEKYLLRNQTPATPAISLLFALDHQLDDMLAEGVENRWARHLEMRDMTLEWARSRDLDIFAAPGFESPTVTCIDNTRNIDVPALNDFLRSRGMIISNGYGSKLKNKTFRIAHMGDTRPSDMEELFANIDDYLTTADR